MKGSLAKIAAAFDERTAQLIRRREDDETVVAHAMARMSTNRFLTFLGRTDDMNKALTALLLIEEARRGGRNADSLLADSLLARTIRALDRGSEPTLNRREAVEKAYREWRNDRERNWRMARIRRKYRPFGSEVEFIVYLIRESKNAGAIRRAIDSRCEYIISGAHLRYLLAALKQLPESVTEGSANANTAAA